MGVDKKDGRSDDEEAVEQSRRDFLKVLPRLRQFAV